MASTVGLNIPASSTKNTSVMQHHSDSCSNKQEYQTDSSTNGDDTDESGVLQIDLGKVKTEPIDSDFTATCTETKLEQKQSISETLTEQIFQRFSRSRYFRRNYSSPESSVCEVCQAEFGGTDVLRLHKIAHFNTAAVCYVCDNTFLDDNGSQLGSKVTLHMVSQHKTLCTPTGNYKPEAERSFVCPICLQRFSSNKILCLHTLKQHNAKELKTISCKICSVDFVNNRNLQAHLMSRHHKEMKIKIQSLFVCVDCRSIFPARDSYAMHMMMRAQSESCTPLEGTFSDLQYLNSTVLLAPKASSPLAASSVPRHSSPVDNAATITNGAIKSEKPAFTKVDYSCDLCNLKFYHPDTLNIHMRMSHNSTPDMGVIQRLTSQQLTTRITSPINKTLSFIQQDMNWPCTVCGQSFHSCDALAMHVMDKHTGPTTSTYTSHILDIRAMVQHKLKQQLNRDIKENENTSEFKLPIIKPGEFQFTNHSQETTANVEDPNINHNVENHKLDNRADEEPRNKCRRMSPETSDLPDLDEDSQNFYSKCSFCQKTFNSKEMLISHLKCCTPKMPLLLCIGCNNKFDTMALYKSHKCHENLDHAEYAVCLTCEEELNASQIEHHFDQQQKCIQLPMLQPVTEIPILGSRRHSLANEESGTNDQNYNGHHDQNSRKDNIADEASRAYYEKDRTENGIDENARNGQQEKTDKNDVLNDSSSTDELNDSHEKDTIIRSLVQDAIAIKRSRRKNRMVTRVLNNNSPEHDCQKGDLATSDVPVNVSNQSGLIAIPISPASSPTLTDALPELNSAGSGVAIDATGHENLQGQSLFNFVLTNSPNLIMCKYCEIIYTNRTMYYLHMGLHNLNNPWQCNLCGKVCANVHEFSSHVIHYR